MTVSGPGAGRIETAYALLSDIIAIHQAAGGRGGAGSPTRPALLRLPRKTEVWLVSDTTVLQDVRVPQLHEVASPYDGRVVGAVPTTGVTAVDALMATARSGAVAAKSLSRHARAAILSTAAADIEHRSEVFARTIVAEAGKTIRQARKEVHRAINTLRLSADEAKRGTGEVIPFDSYAGSENRTGWFTREPLGIIAAITPFNDPLNLVAHKVGPAIAGGNAVVLKPSALTPLSAQLLVDSLYDAGLPTEVLTVVHGGRDVAAAIIATRDVRMVSFTGGFATGEAIARAAGLKKLAMDLGGNAPVIVLDDADVDRRWHHVYPGRSGPRARTVWGCSGFWSTTPSTANSAGSSWRPLLHWSPAIPPGNGPTLAR